MGGRFDPIHLGHLRAAESAREGAGLDRVEFVPAHVPPHRDRTVASARDRYAMVALATAGHPAFVASDVELRREGPSYTVDTLETLRQERPADELFLIVGSDTWPEMPTWRQAERVRALCTVVVVSRPGAPVEVRTGPGVQRVDTPGLDVSATEVREGLRRGRSVRYLVPEAVVDYIQKRGLYRDA